MSHSKQILKTLIFYMLFFSVWITVHEMTHIALNDFRVDAICILDCELMIEKGFFGNHYTPFGVYLAHPINPIARDEYLAHATGLISSVIFGIIFYKKILEKKD